MHSFGRVIRDNDASRVVLRPRTYRPYMLAAMPVTIVRLAVLAICDSTKTTAMPSASSATSGEQAERSNIESDYSEESAKQGYWP